MNTNIVRLALTLRNAKQEFTVDLQPGVNRISLIALNEGSISPNTVGIEYPAAQVLEKRLITNVVNINFGQTFTTTLGLPQIALCRTVFKFPCVTQTYPQSAQHVLEAQGRPPEPITAPLKPGRTGNPLRRVYPRLLTIDRDRRRKDARRNASTAPYQCPNSRLQDKDEYPPAVFVENMSSAHIKCIPLSDNRGAGSSFGTQLREYKLSPTSTPVRLQDQDNIEFVILR